MEGRDPPDRWSPPVASNSIWDLATIVGLVPEAPDTITLRVRLHEPRGFLPGQNYLVRVPVPGTHSVQRRLSVGSSPQPDASVIDLTIKEIAGGLVSPVLVRRIPIGAVLEVRGPYGFFTWTEADGGPVVLIGAGGGIVPLASIIRYATAMDAQVPMALLYSSVDEDHVIYRADLDRLNRECPWLSVVHTLTRDPKDSRARYHRRVDLDMITGVLREPNLASCRADDIIAYLCGPRDFMVTAREALIHQGVPEWHIQSEDWT